MDSDSERSLAASSSECHLAHLNTICLVVLQGRGGRGVTGVRMRDDDTVEEVVNVMDHDTVLFFSPDGICRSLRAYQIPVSSKTAMGTPITQVPAPSLDPHHLACICLKHAWRRFLVSPPCRVQTAGSHHASRLVLTQKGTSRLSSSFERALCAAGIECAQGLGVCSCAQHRHLQ